MQPHGKQSAYNTFDFQSADHHHHHSVNNKQSPNFYDTADLQPLKHQTRFAYISFSL